jgi:hypothetical protein
MLYPHHRTHVPPKRLRLSDNSILAGAAVPCKIVMPKQLLNGADVGAALEQVRGEGMTKGVGTDGLRQTGTADGHRDGLVDTLGST